MTTKEPTKRPVGRPRTHEKAMTKAERVALSTANLVKDGGARMNFRLRKPSVDALNYLMTLEGAPKTKVELVEILLTQAAIAAGKKP